MTYGHAPERATRRSSALRLQPLHSHTALSEAPPCTALTRLASGGSALARATRRIRSRNAYALNGSAARLALLMVGREIARPLTSATQREGVAVDCSDVSGGRARVAARATRLGRSTKA